MKSLSFVFQYAKKYKWALVATIVSMLLLVGAQLLGPWIIKTMIGTVTAPDAGAEAMPTVRRLALLALLVYIARAGLQFVRSYMAHVAGWKVVADTRRRIYDHLQRLSLRFYEDKQTGALMSRMVNDSDMFERLIAHAIPDVAVNVLSLIGVSVILISLNWKLMLLSLIPIPLIILAMRSFAKYVRPAFRERQEELGELNATLNDNLSGIREIQAFTREDVEAVRVSTHIDRYRDSMLKALRLMATFHPVVEFGSTLGTVGLIYFGGQMVLGKVFPLEDLVAFFLYLGQFYAPIQALSGAWEGLQEALAGAERVSDLLDETPDVAESPDAIEIQGRAEGALRFNNVSFHYSKGDTVLDGITLDVPPGTSVALVGPTGVGKTTMANLIPRFYDVVGGSITLDGHDLRDLTLKSLRQQISIVLQTVFLFHGSVRDNILFGRPGATEEEMIRAAQIANAHQFIMQLPEGYDTMIGERGIKLSGGQRQRVAIARAVLKDAPILILDEATSSVDTETELLIQQALERLMVGRTTVIIAHRLSTIRNADVIAVLSGSRVVEMGSHRELISREDGLYRRMNMIQQEIDIKLQTVQTSLMS